MSQAVQDGGGGGGSHGVLHRRGGGVPRHGVAGEEDGQRHRANLQAIPQRQQRVRQVARPVARLPGHDAGGAEGGGGQSRDALDAPDAPLRRRLQKVQAREARDGLFQDAQSRDAQARASGGRGGGGGCEDGVRSHPGPAPGGVQAAGGKQEPGVQSYVARVRADAGETRGEGAVGVEVSRGGHGRGSERVGRSLRRVQAHAGEHTVSESNVNVSE